QDPYGSLNPVHTIFHHLARPLQIHKKVSGKKELTDKVHELLEEVGLTPAAETAQKFPFELSGGQRQRVCIAKTLAIGADVILADEPTSALDVSIRLGILNLMEKMKKENNVAFMYITHDLATARYFAERTAVMYVGHMVEWGETEDIIQQPKHPYTQLLISAVPDPLKRKQKKDQTKHVKNKDIPIWSASSKGCPFVSRCGQVMDKCSQSMPKITKVSEQQYVRCFLYE
ncbi:MAG: ABC transporter ATP-binding protein, partial [Leucothrix sp.]